MEKFSAAFSVSAPVVYKNPPPMRPEILYTTGAGKGVKAWDRNFPLENTKSPHPENPGKLLKNYNLAHPGTVLKIAGKLLKNTKLPKNY